MGVLELEWVGVGWDGLGWWGGEGLCAGEYV